MGPPYGRGATRIACEEGRAGQRKPNGPPGCTRPQMRLHTDIEIPAAPPSRIDELTRVHRAASASGNHRPLDRPQAIYSEQSTLVHRRRTTRRRVEEILGAQLFFETIALLHRSLGQLT